MAATSGEAWEPGGQLQCKSAMQRDAASLPKLSQKVVSLALITRESTHASCHLCDGPKHLVNSKAVVFWSLLLILHMLPAPKARMPLAPPHRPFPPPTFALQCPAPSSPLLPSRGTHTCTHMCLHTQYYRAFWTDSSVLRFPIKSLIPKMKVLGGRALWR